MYSYYVLLTFLCRRNSRSRSRSPSSRYCNLFTLFSHLIYCQSESTFKLTVELLSVQSTAPCTFSTVRFHYIQSDISAIIILQRTESKPFKIFSWTQQKTSALTLAHKYSRCLFHYEGLFSNVFCHSGLVRINQITQYDFALKILVQPYLLLTLLLKIVFFFKKSSPIINWLYWIK